MHTMVENLVVTVNDARYTLQLVFAQQSHFQLLVGKATTIIVRNL